jgi:uncharacterized protein (TIGR03086 family)
MDTLVMADAIESFQQRLDLVDAGQWKAPTPCADWDLHTLVNHVLGELLWIPPLLEGRTIAEVGDQFDGDLLGDDPHAAWAAAAAEAIAAASQFGVQDRIVHLSFGDLPGADYLGQVTSDIIIHTWDLARAVGGDDRLSAALVEFVATELGPQIEAWRGAGVFGPAVDVDPELDSQDRLLAQTGRSPTWPA